MKVQENFSTAERNIIERELIKKVSNKILNLQNKIQRKLWSLRSKLDQEISNVIEHTIETPKVCTLRFNDCSMEFEQSMKLAGHINAVHGKLSPLQCSQCQNCLIKEVDSLSILRQSITMREQCIVMNVPRCFWRRIK